MTRRTRNHIALSTLSIWMLTIAATGCGPDPKDQKIAELTTERDGLQRQLDDRDRELGDALVREDDARKSISELSDELARMRAEGAKVKDTEGWITGSGFDMITIPGSVLFASGKAILTSGGQRTLEKIASDIRSRYPNRDIYVFGHTDDQPIRKSKWKDNWELGANRALTVIRHLSSAGVPPESLIQASCAQYRPRDSGASEKGRRQNRRVEFYAVERTGGAIRTTSAGPMRD